MIGARATSHIYLTETDSDAQVVLIQALTGNARFTVRETNEVDEHLNLLPNGSVLFLENAKEVVALGLVNTPTGSILLRVGDIVTTDPNSQILAGQNIDIYGDFARTSGPVLDVATPTDSPRYGTVMHLSGVLAHGSTGSGFLTRIFGNANVDQFFFDQTFLGGANPTIPGGAGQTIPQGGVLSGVYPGGRTRVYGSNTPATAGTFAPVGDAEDFFIVNQLQTMTIDQQTAAGVVGGDTLTLDGQSGTDTYVINTTGTQGVFRDYVINTLDSGAPDDGVDTLSVYGLDNNDPGFKGANGGFDDVFLMRRMRDLSGETANRPTLYADNPAFVAVLHGTFGQVTASDPNADSGVRPQEVQRVNYDAGNNGRLFVYGQGGNDLFASDDVAAITTLDGGEDNDSFQIGQLYGLQRDGSQPAGGRQAAWVTRSAARW